VGVLRGRRLAEERIGLVEQEDDVGPLGPVKDAPQVLFCFSDLLGDQGVEAPTMQIPGKAGFGDLSREGLAGTVGP
jgi:hypothetical protein